MAGYEIERFLAIRGAGNPSIGPEGERVAFLIDTTGTDQVWSLDEPGGWPDQLTFYDERVTFAEWSPERPELVFGMDQGGNERVQLYRLAGDGSAIDPLTDRPDAKHRWGGWDHDGDRFAFAANRREESVFDVYVQDRDGEPDAAELIWEGDGWYTIAGWGPEDERLLLHEARASFDHDLYLLDLPSGAARQLTDDEGPVRYGAPNWGPEGNALYLVTDRDRDTLSLARLDLSTGVIDIVENGGAWNVDGVELHDDTGRFVMGRNVDGYTELTIGQLTGPTSYKTLAEPSLGPGVLSTVDFGPDGERFAVTVSGRTENPNVYVLEAASGAATRWTDAATAGIPQETFAEPELVRYESFDGREIPAFYTVPEEATPGETPVVMDIHGGPESQRRPSFHAVAQYFVGRGYAVFEPNVRGSSGYGRAYTHLDDVEQRMDSVRDLRAAVDWLGAQPVPDSDRVVALGGSYGGFMVLAALTEYPDLWAAGVDIVGIANFVTFLENTGDWRRELREAEYGRLDDDREFLESISPINQIERLEAPLFVAHGENDPRVPVGEARQIVEKAASQGVPVQSLFFDDEGHGFSKLENRIEAYSAIAAFLDEHV
ncbi:MAG: alpha/beta fold hydrolase [Halobacteriales archaeon]